MQIVANWILEELKRTPVALFSVCVLGWLVYGLMQDHVGIAEFRSLRDQMTGVQVILQHDHIDTRIHQVESELFNLSQHVIDEKAKNREVDSLYSIRINELTRQDNDLKRQLDLLDRTGMPAK